MVGKNTTFTYFQSLGWNSVNDGRALEIKTKQMETDKTEGEEAEVMNWERGSWKGSGDQRGPVGTGPGRKWTRRKFPAVISAAIPSGVTASPGPLGFCLPWGLEWCLTSIISALWAHLAWGRLVFSLSMFAQRESVVPEWEDLWFHPTCFCPSWWGLLTARVMWSWAMWVTPGYLENCSETTHPCAEQRLKSKSKFQSVPQQK